MRLLDTPVEPGLDRFVEQSAHAFAAPIALLTIIHDDQMSIRASTGIDLTCLPRKEGFCHYAVDRDDVFEVCDAQADPFFRDLPCVAQAPHVRYYIGAPLTLSRNLDVGMLCILDTHARPSASPDQRAYLSGVARQAARLIERHATVRGDLAA